MNKIKTKNCLVSNTNMIFGKLIYYIPGPSNEQKFLPDLDFCSFHFFWFVWRKIARVCTFGFICFWILPTLLERNCCLRPFDSFCGRLMGFCARFAHDFGTHSCAKMWLCLILTILHEFARIEEKCYESLKSATTGNWAFICVTNEDPGWIIFDVRGSAIALSICLNGACPRCMICKIRPHKMDKTLL